ncbi:MAG: AAA family ATPase, partial [Selenomonas sp.]|uniref:ATP-binding protein n=1 Tax=Selenomonas sp. TaxID=2053611 RepID=UPI0025E66DD7
MSSMLRKLPIGVQSFAHLQREGYLYVDKTKYIHELVNGSKQYFLSRPRRFGKSLFLSTLKAYWQGQKELFSGLYIAAEEEKSAHPWQAYPVFVFDFNGKNYQKAQALENVLDEKLRGWEQEYALSGTQSLEERFRLLLAAAKEKSGRPCVVLVDEYDKPLLDVMADETLAEHNKAVFKGFFGVLKSCDEYLQFVFITGVTKFSKVSIFSDLNHLKDISMNKKYAAICGITENELTDTLWPQLEKFAEVQVKTTKDCQQKLRRTYDGYHFHPQGEGVYNPFSLLNALDDGELRSYWF